jgi:hypothetical protein
MTSEKNMSCTELHKYNGQKKKDRWHAPRLLNLALPFTSGNKDALAPQEGNRGRGGKVEVSPS